MPEPTDTEVEQPKPGSMQDTQWQGDFNEEDLKVPYKREDSEQDEEDPKEETSEVDADSEPAETVDDEPTPVVTVQDPGEYRSTDYSFEIEIDGKTHKVDSPEKAEQLGEEYADKLTAKQLFALISKGSKIDLKQERDHDQWEAAKKKFDDQVATQTKRNETVTAIASEIEYLVGKGKLPKVAKEYKDANWAEPEVAKQPGVKEQVALLNYMNKENAIREKANIRPLGPVDALTAMQSDAAETAKVDRAKQAGVQRRAAGAKVAGVAPASSAPYVPKGVAVGRTGVFNRGAAMWD